MEIKYGKQVDSKDISGIDISLMLLAGNHEERVYTAYNKISINNNVLKTVVLCYNNSFNLDYSKKIEKKTIKNHKEISSILNDEFLNNTSQDINIVVDYSCMTKSWYYTIILYLKEKKLDINSITVFFTYTPSKYSKPQLPKTNTEIAPLPGKYVVPTDKPKALIVCLGYEQNKAQGIIEHLDPKICFIYYSKPALDKNFVETIELNNKDILEKDNNVITFPLEDLIFLEKDLTALYYSLRNEYSVIIAPLGPKPFSFISMLMSIKYNDIDIWRVGSGSDINMYTREPLDNNSFIISKVVFHDN